MNPIKKINLTDSHPRRKKSFRKFFLVFIILAVFLLGLFFWFSTSTSTSIFSFVIPGSPIKSSDDRVNILLLGNAGGNHDGAMLTDSIIVASYNLKSRSVTLISVPRDLWLDSVKAKTNAVYEIGQARGDGLKFAEDKIDDILGIPIQYGIRIDFNGFAEAIDLVGGVDVNVANAFDDFEYPIQGMENELCGNVEKEVDISSEQASQLGLQTGKQKVFVDLNDHIATQSADFPCRFERIHFDKGNIYMNGETALKFVRSRHGLSNEGSDFARSKRQQLVLQAFRSKVLSLQTLANPQKITGLVETFGKSFETDIPTTLFLNFYGLVENAGSTKSIVLGNLDDGKSVFINPPLSDYGGAWVLIPPNNDFTLVKEYLKKVLNENTDTGGSTK